MYIHSDLIKQRGVNKKTECIPSDDIDTDNISNINGLTRINSQTMSTNDIISSCNTESKRRQSNFNDIDNKDIIELNMILRQKDDLILNLYNEIKLKNDKIQDMSDTIIKLNENNVKHMLEKSQNNFEELSQKVMNIQQNLNNTFHSSNRDYKTNNHELSSKNKLKFNTSE